MGHGVPKKGPGSITEPMILVSHKMHCPKCKGTDNIWRNEVVPRSIKVKVEPDGTWELSEIDEVCWIASSTNSEEPEFFCRNCDIYFEAENTVCPDQEVAVKLTKSRRIVKKRVR